MIYMLDTNILIYLIKNKPPSVAERVDNLQPDDQLCMSFITYAELLKGAERSTRKPQVLQNLARLSIPNTPLFANITPNSLITLKMQVHPSARMICGLLVTP